VHECSTITFVCPEQTLCEFVVLDDCLLVILCQIGVHEVRIVSASVFSVLCFSRNNQLTVDFNLSHVRHLNTVPTLEEVESTSNARHKLSWRGSTSSLRSLSRGVVELPLIGGMGLASKLELCLKLT
jgi:hypothetical protein